MLFKDLGMLFYGQLDVVKPSTRMEWLGMTREHPSLFYLGDLSFDGEHDSVSKQEDSLE